MANEKTFGAERKTDESPDFVDDNKYARPLPDDSIFYNVEEEKIASLWTKEFNAKLAEAREHKKQLEKKRILAEALIDATVQQKLDGNYVIIVDGQMYSAKGKPLPDHTVSADDLRDAASNIPRGEYRDDPDVSVDNLVDPASVVDEPQGPKTEQVVNLPKDANKVKALKLVERIYARDVEHGKWEYLVFMVKPGQVWEDKLSGERLTVEYIMYDPKGYKHMLKFAERPEAEDFKLENGSTKFGYRDQIVRIFSNLRKIDGPDLEEKSTVIGSVFDDSVQRKEPKTLILKDGIIAENPDTIESHLDQTAPVATESVSGVTRPVIEGAPKVTTNVLPVSRIEDKDMKDANIVEKVVEPVVTTPTAIEKKDEDVDDTRITIDSVVDAPVDKEKTAEDIVEAVEEEDPIKILAKNFKITGLVTGDPDRFNKQISALAVFSARLFDYDVEKESEILTNAKKELEAVGIKIAINDRNINDSYIDKLYDLAQILRKKYDAIKPVSHSVEISRSLADSNNQDKIGDNLSNESFSLKHEEGKIVVKEGGKYQVKGEETILTVLNITKKDDGRFEIRFDNIKEPAVMTIDEWTQIFENLTEVKENGTI